MRPPRVYDVSIPRAHRTRRIRRSVQSMVFPFFRLC
jgi:hypothetical protein